MKICLQIDREKGVYPFVVLAVHDDGHVVSQRLAATLSAAFLNLVEFGRDYPHADVEIDKVFAGSVRLIL